MNVKEKSREEVISTSGRWCWRKTDMFSNKEIFNLKPSKEILELQQDVVNDLEPKQKGKIDELRNRVEDLLKPAHNDFYLLKWLKFRKFDVSAAENMLISHLKWREEYRVDHIHEEFDPPEVLVKYWPFNVVGEDKDGSPLLIVASGNIDFKGAMHSIQKSDFVKFYIYLLEYLEKVTIQQSEKHKKLISTFTLISDLENGKLRDFTWKPAMDMMGYVHVKVFESNYPEFGKKAFAINVPTMAKALCTMLKPFMSKEYKAKLTVFGKDGWKKTLLEMVNPDQLPRHLGGNLNVNGNPGCKIVMGGPIPKFYYRTLKMDRDRRKSATIRRKGMMKADIEITKMGSVISWTFQTEHYDLGFGLSFNPNSREHIANIKNQVVIPLDRANSYLVPEEGKWNCQEKGIYTVTFDNSYSWFRSKKLIYFIQVLTPDSVVTEITLSSPD